MYDSEFETQENNFLPTWIKIESQHILIISTKRITIELL